MPDKLKKKRNTKYLIGFIALLLVCAVFVAICLNLIIHCAKMYRNELTQCLETCCGEKFQKKDVNYLVVIGAASIGILASIIQIAAAFKSFISSLKKIRVYTIDESKSTIAKLQKYDIILSITSKENEALVKAGKMSFDYRAEFKQFVMGLDLRSYIAELCKTSSKSTLLYKIIGEDNYHFIIQNPRIFNNSNNNINSKYVGQKILESIQVSLDDVAVIIDEYLCKYYEGLFDDKLFESFKNSYFIEYIEIIRYYAALRYEKIRLKNLKLYNYKYLITFIKQNFSNCDKIK